MTPTILELHRPYTFPIDQKNDLFFRKHFNEVTARPLRVAYPTLFQHSRYSLKWLKFLHTMTLQDLVIYSLLKRFQEVCVCIAK